MKRVLIIVGVIVAVLLLAFFGLRMNTKSKSPEAVAEIDQNGLHVTVDYCQPYKKGRKIFGGLVPYGKVWRTGANEATTIKFNQNVLVAGQPVDAGKYSLWTVPSEGGWIVILSSEIPWWGTEYDQTKDLMRAPIVARKRTPPMEQFNINFSAQNDGTDMLLAWDETEAVVPIRKRQ